jgi:hypothetical protein
MMSQGSFHFEACDWEKRRMDHYCGKLGSRNHAEAALNLHVIEMLVRELSEVAALAEPVRFENGALQDAIGLV